MSITNAVKEVLEDKLFITECMQLDLINYSALANFIFSEIEESLGKNVKMLSVSMALRRYTSSLKKLYLNNLNIDPKTELMSRSNLSEFTIKKTDKLEKQLSELSRVIENQNGVVLSLIHGTQNVVILVSTKFSSQIRDIIGIKSILFEKHNLGAIFMGIPSEYRNYPGLFYQLTRKLAFHNINLLSLSNIDTEVLFVFHNNEVPKAFQVLYNLIKND